MARQRVLPRRKLAFALLLLGFLVSAHPSMGQSSNPKPSGRLITHPEAVRTLPTQDKRWALLIGVDRYEDSNISPLGGAGNDARGLREVLVNHAGFPQDQVIVLSSEEPAERQPTRRNVLRRLSNLSGLVPKDGLLLVSFAGHGIDRNGQGFLIPSDATFTEDISLLEETAISVRSIKQRIKDTGVQQVMIFLDACRSYPVGRANTPNRLTTAFTGSFDFDVANQEVWAFAVLYATEVGYRAYEYSEKRQGYFSWAIAQALKGGAANERGEVTLGALVKYLEVTVPKLVAVDYGTKVIQKPFANIEGYRSDELVLSLTDRKATFFNSDKQSGSDSESLPNSASGALTPRIGKPDGKQGKVLVSSAVSAGERRVTDQLDKNEVLAPLIESLRQADLTVTTESALTQKDRVQIDGTRLEIMNGRKAVARSAPFIVNVDVVFAVEDRAPFSGMEISVANITLMAINLETGEVVAIETIESKGFGTDHYQARRNALREAGQRIPRGFINRVAVSSGKLRSGTNLGGGIRP